MWSFICKKVQWCLSLPVQQGMALLWIMGGYAVCLCGWWVEEGVTYTECNLVNECAFNLQQTATAQQQSSLVPTIDLHSGGAFLGHGSVMVMLTAVMLLMNTRTAHEDLAQKMSSPVVMACASVMHTGL